jgi:hypothetical protein
VRAQFREYSMHGSLERVKRVAPAADVHATEAGSGRTALHKATPAPSGERRRCALSRPGPAV